MLRLTSVTNACNKHEFQTMSEMSIFQKTVKDVKGEKKRATSTDVRSTIDKNVSPIPVALATVLPLLFVQILYVRCKKN
jgi:hypothetical protein